MHAHDAPEGSTTPTREVATLLLAESQFGMESLLVALVLMDSCVSIQAGAHLT